MGAKPATKDLCRSRGDTFADEFTVKNTAGVVVDVTGASFLQTIDPDPDPTASTNNLFQLTGALVDAVNGVISFTPNATQADQTPNTYFHDIQMTDSSGAIRSIAKGEYVILQDITK